jgi:serine/threonine protein kinase
MAAEWDKISVFSTDARDVHREAAAHRTLTNPADNHERGQRFILGYRGYRLVRWLKYYRIATEWAQGGDLAAGDLYKRWHPSGQTTAGVTGYEHANYEPMPIDWVYRLFKALVLACQHMHNKGLVHRDIKPENIFIRRIYPNCAIMKDRGISPVLADFGATIPVRPRRYENPTDVDWLQTPEYAAPEQFIGVPPFIPDPNDPHTGHEIAEPATVFSLAMTMWSVMLLGQLPFDGDPLWPHTYDWQDRYPGKPDEISYIRKWMRTPGSRGGVANDRFMNKYWRNDPEGRWLISKLVQCLRRDPADRPSLADLDDHIQAWLDHPPDDDDNDDNPDNGNPDNGEPNNGGPGDTNQGYGTAHGGQDDDEEEYEPPEFI